MAVADLTAHRLTVVLSRAQRSARLPSVVASLVRDGEVVWEGAAGRHPGPAADAPGPDVQYRIGSITKTFTALLVHRLVAEGRLDLDQPVGSVLGPIGYADRTVRSLLVHDSGMQAEPAGPWWEAAPGVDWAELAAANDGSLAAFPAHRRFHYSNLGFALLGRVVEELTGQSWWAALQEQVLRPLGLTRTTYHPEAPAAQGYSVHPYAHTLREEPATDTRAMAPAGQLWSTSHDLAAYARFLLRGHPEVLPLAALQQAEHPQSGDRDDALGRAQGLGFALVRGGSGMLVGHTGSMPGFLAATFVDRVRDSGVAVLTNATTGLTPLDLATALLDTLEECEPSVGPQWEPETAVPEEIRELLGPWYWGNTLHEFGCEAGRLVVRRRGEPQYAFDIREGRIVGTAGYLAGETLRVHRGVDATASHLEVASFVFTREPPSS